MNEYRSCLSAKNERKYCLKFCILTPITDSWVDTLRKRFERTC